MRHQHREHPDGRTIALTFKLNDGEVVRELPLDGLPLYRGTVKSGQTGFKAGDAYTWGGSIYICRSDTDQHPPGDHWQLAVKGTR